MADKEDFKKTTKGYKLDICTAWRFNELKKRRPIGAETLVKIALMEYMDRNDTPYPTKEELDNFKNGTQ